MKIDILTLFPGMFKGALSESIVKRACQKGIVSIRIHNLRKWTTDAHKTADDKPFGGGPGMVMKIEPVYKALVDILGDDPRGLMAKGDLKDKKIIILTPQGVSFSQGLARRFARYKHLILICGHYEGMDERIRDLVTDEISIGDYVLTGGEIPAMAVTDAVVRLVPGALGEGDSVKEESFENDLLEYPQYTRPREFKGMMVPEVLFSGDHKKIADWRKKEAVKKTKSARPDLIKGEKNVG